MKILSQCKICIFLLILIRKSWQAWWDSPMSWFFFSLSLCLIISFGRSVTDDFVSWPSASVISPSSECVSVCLSAGAAVQSPCWVMKACAIYSGQGGRERRWDVLYRHDCKDDLWRSEMHNKNAKKKWQFVCITNWNIIFLYLCVYTHIHVVHKHAHLCLWSVIIIVFFHVYERSYAHQDWIYLDKIQSI